MRKSAQTIVLALAGLTLSTMLQGCGHPEPLPAPPAAIATPLRQTPPADLLACPERPDGFPADASAVMPPDVRRATMGLAHAYAQVRGQLERLIEWERPGACPEPQ